nr:(2Fe-2S)-binding protein [Chloroflexia bacterium]
VDESPEPGGRLLGQLHRVGRRNDEFHRDGWWDGRRIAIALAEEAAAAGVRFLQGCGVWGLYPQWKVCVGGAQPGVIEAARVVIATGAAEVPIPIPGWTLPGVMTIGAGQVLATQHRVRPGNTGIVVGINPLSLAIARELGMAGTEVTAIVNTPPGPLAGAGNAPSEVIADLARAAHLAPSRLLRVGGRLGTFGWAARLAARLQPAGGVRVWGIAVDPRRTVTAILGANEVERVVVAELSPAGEIVREREMPVEAVFLAGGLRPLAELAGVAGCRIIAVPELGGTVPLHGPGLETTASGVSVAGNVIGIESAVVAMAQGRLAATAMVAPHSIADERRRVSRARHGAPISFLPRIDRGHEVVARAWQDAEHGDDGGEPARAAARTAALPPERSANPDPFAGLDQELIVCRCEEVTIGMVRRVAADGFTSAEEIKRFTRMTMGACQGRVCQGILERIQAASGDAPRVQPTVPGHRPPIRPVTLGELASLASGGEEWERLHGSLLPSMPFDDPAGGRVGDPRL